MSNRELPMMPWFPKEFAAATSTWSFAERSAYRALLDVQWEMGVLPEETWRLAQAIGIALDEFEALWPMVRTKFTAAEGGIRNERLEEHRVTAFTKKQGHRIGAQTTNAKRRANRGAEQHAERVAERSAKRHASVAPPSPSPSPSEEEDPPNPPEGGATALSRGRSPERQRHDASRTAWIRAEIHRKKDDFDALKRLDPLAAEAIRLVGGFHAIGMSNTDRLPQLRARFRECYEHLMDASAGSEGGNKQKPAGGEP